MQKAILSIEETLKYRREVPVELPDSMSEDDLNSALDAASRGADTVDDIVYGLRRFGIQQTEPYDKDLDSPDYCEAECDDYKLVTLEEVQ